MVTWEKDDDDEWGWFVDLERGTYDEWLDCFCISDDDARQDIEKLLKDFELLCEEDDHDVTAALLEMKLAELEERWEREERGEREERELKKIEKTGSSSVPYLCYCPL